MNDNILQNTDSNQRQAELENIISELPVAEEQQDEVKGGPIYMQYEGIKGNVTAPGFEKRVQ